MFYNLHFIRRKNYNYLLQVLNAYLKHKKKHLYYIATGEQLIEDGATWAEGSLLKTTNELAEKKEIKKELIDSDEEPAESLKPLENNVTKTGTRNPQRKAKSKRKKADSDIDDETINELDSFQDEENLPVKKKKKARMQLDKQSRLNNSSKKRKKPTKTKKKTKQKCNVDNGEDEDSDNLEDEPIVNRLKKKVKKETKQIKSRRKKKKKSKPVSEDESSGNDYLIEEPMELEEMEDDTIGNDYVDDEEKDFLSEEYTDMVKELREQQVTMNRDADIEKELILEELKDMVKVVPPPAPAQDDSSVSSQPPKDSEKELLLKELKEMFKQTGDKLINKYDIFKPAIQAMISSFRCIKSESALLGFYHSMGKYNGIPSIKRNQQDVDTTARYNGDVSDRCSTLQIVETPITVETPIAVQTIQTPITVQTPISIETPISMGKYVGTPVKRYLQENELTNPIKYIATPTIRRSIPPQQHHHHHEVPLATTNHLQTFNLQQTSVGNYTYLNEGYYNMMVTHHNDLQVQENVTIHSSTIQ
uniref:Uncharacterized protein n=1 Tax=Cacopsylla melanoneura TaxID=428564 RepID=A0A8D8ZJ36_9HEMI